MCVRGGGGGTGSLRGRGIWVGMSITGLGHKIDEDRPPTGARFPGNGYRLIDLDTEWEGVKYNRGSGRY